MYPSTSGTIRRAMIKKACRERVKVRDFSLAQCDEVACSYDLDPQGGASSGKMFESGRSNFCQERADLLLSLDKKLDDLGGKPLKG
jgi:hypothetical protein